MLEVVYLAQQSLPQREISTRHRLDLLIEGELPPARDRSLRERFHLTDPADVQHLDRLGEQLRIRRMLG